MSYAVYSWNATKANDKLEYPLQEQCLACMATVTLMIFDISVMYKAIYIALPDTTV